MAVHLHVLKVDDVNASRHFFNLHLRRAPTVLRPINVQNKAPFCRVGLFRHVVDEALAVKFLVFKAVVVVMQLHARVVQLVGSGAEILQKRAHTFQRARVFLRHHADAHVVRTENAVVLNHLFGVLQNELRVRMRNDDGKPVFIANLADDMRVNVAERGDLQGLVADVMQLFRRLSKIGFVLRIVADGEALCTDDHEKFLPKVRLYAGVRGETAVHRDCDAGHKTGRVIVDEEAQCAE